MRTESCASNTDRRCLFVLAAILAAMVIVYELTDGQVQNTEANDPQDGVVVQLPLTAQLLPVENEPVDALLLPPVDDKLAAIPLSPALQTVLCEACEANGVPICLALGVMEVESGFDPEADSGVSFGLMQLNRRYYPDDLSHAENIIAGVEHLASQLEWYEGDTQAALTSYNAGYDTGRRSYAQAVLAASEKWGVG